MIFSREFLLKMERISDGVWFSMQYQLLVYAWFGGGAWGFGTDNDGNVCGIVPFLRETLTSWVIH